MVYIEVDRLPLSEPLTVSSDVDWVFDLGGGYALKSSGLCRVDVNNPTG